MSFVLKSWIVGLSLIVGASLSFASESWDVEIQNDSSHTVTVRIEGINCIDRYSPDNSPFTISSKHLTTLYFKTKGGGMFSRCGWKDSDIEYVLMVNNDSFGRLDYHKGNSREGHLRLKDVSDSSPVSIEQVQHNGNYSKFVIRNSN